MPHVSQVNCTLQALNYELCLTSNKPWFPGPGPEGHLISWGKSQDVGEHFAYDTIHWKGDEEGRDEHPKGRGSELGASVPSLNSSFSQNLYMVSDPEDLWSLSLWIWWRFHYVGMID